MMEAVQMIRLGYDGLRIGLDVTGATVREVKNVTMFIIGMLNQEKLSGKTRLKNMLKKSGNLQVLQVKESDLKQVEEYFKKYKILYSKLPDLNTKDNMTEFIFEVEATPRVNAIIQKLSDSKIENISDYVNNGNNEKVDKTIDYFKKNNLVKDANIESKSLPAKDLEDIANDIKYNANINDLDKVDITISKNLVATRNVSSLKTRVPGTFGDNIRYLTIDRKDIMAINNGQTYLSFLNKEKEYELTDKDGKVVEKIKGEDLSKNHYDKVLDETRDKALREKERAKNQRNKQKAQAKIKREQQRAKEMMNNGKSR